MQTKCLRNIEVIEAQAPATTLELALFNLKTEASDMESVTKKIVRIIKLSNWQEVLKGDLFMPTQQEVMKTFMKSLDETEKSGRSALDEAIQKSSNFGSYQEVISKFYTDWMEAGNWHTFLVRYCGIILDNKDTGAVSGSDAGGSTPKSATDIIPSEGEANYPAGSSFTVDGLTIYGIPPKDELTEDQQYVVQGLYSWWIRDALALIKESYGLTYTDANTTNSRLRLKFYEDEESGTLTSVSFSSVNGTKKEFESYALSINMAKFRNMSWNDRHGSIGNITLDRILTHELVHGIMSSNVNYLSDLPGVIVEGATAEIIHGIDDMRYYELIFYAKNIGAIIQALSTEIMLSNSVYEIYTGGYMFMRYFLKQAADTIFDYDTYKKKIAVDADSFATNYWDEVKIVGNNGDDTITNSGEKVSINAKNGNNTIKNYSDKVTIKSGSGNDRIDNESSDVKITSGMGSDTIDNAGTSVTVRAGSGGDFIYNEEESSDSRLFGGNGNDTIYNYGASNLIFGEQNVDSINNYGLNASISGGLNADVITNAGNSAMIWGDDDNDMIVNGEKATAFSEQNMGGKFSTIYGGMGNDSISNYSAESYIYGDNGNDSISNAGIGSKIYGGANNDHLENFGDTSAIYGDMGNDIFKNDGDDSTLNGGAGKDTFTNYGDEVYIYGGTGNDSVYNSGAWNYLDGGLGNDYFYNEGTAVYISGGAGKDTIYNFGEHATISSDSGSDYIVNDGGKHITYNFGASFGKDTVVGFNANDTIKITSGGYSAVMSGDDVIISTESSSLLLKNASEMAINFIDESGDMETKIFSSGENSAFWFTEENTFATAHNLDAIIKADLTSVALKESELLPHIRGGSFLNH